MLQVGKVVKQSQVNNCFGAELLPNGNVKVTNTNDPSGASVEFTRAEWEEAEKGFRVGTFAHPA